MELAGNGRCQMPAAGKPPAAAPPAGVNWRLHLEEPQRPLPLRVHRTASRASTEGMAYPQCCVPPARGRASRACWRCGIHGCQRLGYCFISRFGQGSKGAIIWEEERKESRGKQSGIGVSTKIGSKAGTSPLQRLCAVPLAPTLQPLHWDSSASHITPSHPLLIRRIQQRTLHRRSA